MFRQSISRKEIEDKIDQFEIERDFNFRNYTDQSNNEVTRNICLGRYDSLGMVISELKQLLEG